MTARPLCQGLWQGILLGAPRNVDSNLAFENHSQCMPLGQSLKSLNFFFFLYLKYVSSKSVENNKQRNISKSTLKITKGYTFLGKDFFHVIWDRSINSGILTYFPCWLRNKCCPVVCVYSPSNCRAISMVYILPFPSVMIAVDHHLRICAKLSLSWYNTLGSQLWNWLTPVPLQWSSERKWNLPRTSSTSW